MAIPSIEVVITNLIRLLILTTLTISIVSWMSRCDFFHFNRQRWIVVLAIIMSMAPSFVSSKLGIIPASLMIMLFTQLAKWLMQLEDE